MTLYLLFERLESGKLKLDSELEVSEHASEQAPTKLGLRPGQTIRSKTPSRALVTRSANDASVVIAEAIAGDEDDFAKLMTRKARALGMSKTVYRNANGLPNDEQVTTARDQATLGRAIQDRFPRYYRYFATSTFVYRGHAIRNHNRLLGNVEGVDGIKTGYTRASGFNLVTSMRRGNRHLVGVVLGGRSGGSRDATMRNLLAENLEKGATNRTVAAITERGVSEANAEVAEAEAAARPTQTVQAQGAIQVASAVGAGRSADDAFDRKAVVLAAATAPYLPPARIAAAPPQARTEPAPLTSGVIQTQQIAAIPGSSEPMKPVRVKTVQVKAGPIKLASAAPDQPATPVTNAITAARAKCRRHPAPWWPKPKPRPRPKPSQGQPPEPEMPPQPANHGTGQRNPRGICRPRAPRPPPPRRRWPMRIRPPRATAADRSAERRHQARQRATPAGSFRSAPSKAKAKHGRASKPPAARPRACLPRPSRSPSRSSPRTTASCTGPASPASTAIRPRRCARR